MRLAAVIVLAVVAASGTLVAFELTGTAQTDLPALCDAARQEGLLASRITGKKGSYATDAKIESPKVFAYLRGGARPPDAQVTTHMGKHLVYGEDLCRTLEEPPPTTDTTTTTTTTEPPPTTTEPPTTTDPPPSAPLVVSPGGNDSTCARGGSACATWNRAYQLASCGDRIDVQPGTYGSQSIREVAALSACAGNVVIDAEGATVNGGVSLGGNNAGPGPGGDHTDAPDRLTLRGFTYSGTITMWGDATFVLVEDVSGGSVLIQGAQDVTIRNSEFGPCPSFGGSCTRFFILDGSAEGEATRTSRILVEGNAIHDYTITRAGDHWECIFATGGVDVTIRGNRVWNCDTYDLVLGDNAASGGFVRWTVENNWFGDTCCFGGLRGTGGSSRESAINLFDVRDALIRFNSFAPGQKVTNENPGSGRVTNVRVIGNILGASGCADGATYTQNLFRGSGTCGTGGQTITAMPYVNPSAAAAMDYHLTSGSAAEAFVTSVAADAQLDRDIDGQPRTTPRDAGSDER